MDTQGKKLHYRRENNPICNICNTILQTDILKHMTDAHCASYFYKCHLCRNYSGPNRSSLFQHQKDKHDVSYFYLACPICMEFNSREEKEVMTHLVQVHTKTENLFVCNYCSFKSTSNLDAHYKEAHSHYVCVFQYCQEVCQNSMKLYQHYMGHHFPKLTLFYGCSRCDVTYPNQNSLYQHERDKHGIMEYDSEDEEETFIELQCSMCSFTTYDKKSYEKHFTNKHPGNYFNCTYKNCNYQTKLFRGLTQHTFDKHFSDSFERFECYLCEEVSYSQLHSLIQHLRDKHYEVNYCSLCHTHENDLYEHIGSSPDHSFDVFSCEICNEEYEEKAELVDHLVDKHNLITPLLRRLCFGN